MINRTVTETSKVDAIYYLIPQLNKVVPYHGGHYTANKLLAQAGLSYILAEELPLVTAKQVATFFPTYEKVWIEREVTKIPKRENKIVLLSTNEILCRDISKEF